MIDQRQVRYFEMQQRRSPGGRFFIPLADLYRRLGRLDEAAALLEEGLARHPGSLSGRVVLALTLQERGERERAGELWRQVLAEDPGHAFAEQRLAELAEPGETVAEAESAEGETEASPPPAEGTPAAPAAPAAGADAVGREEPRAPSGPPEPPVVPRLREQDTEAAEDAPTEAPAAAERDAAPEPASGAAATESGPAAEFAEPAPGVPEVFLTGTLADIYLRQGHRRKALQILRRILAQHPDREDVARRIAELERDDRPGEAG